MVFLFLFQRKKLQLNSSGHEGHEDGEEGSCLASRHQRASIFADWILGKRRSDLSSPDHIILDVAGGRKCEVGFELKIKRFREVKAEVICIDPRAAESKRPKWKSKIMKKVMEKNNVGEDQHAVELKHMQAMFNKDLLDKLRHDDQGGQVRLILGMHPDEATEPIVDLALKNGISFAIVPCCVFAHSNPERRLKSSGEEPRTYQQFCDYLMEKDPAIQSDCLGFRGRDRVLYRFFLDGS